MTTHTALRRTTAGIAIAGLAAGATILAAGAATAAPAHTTASALPCTANQFTAHLVASDPGAGQRYGYLELTAKRGERCVLPGNLAIRLVGAHNVLLHSSASRTSPGAALVDGSSAYLPLHWTGIEAESQQQTPNALTVVAPADSNPHGDYVNPDIDVQWTLGAVDAAKEAHTIDIGTVYSRCPVTGRSPGTRAAGARVSGW